MNRSCFVLLVALCFAACQSRRNSEVRAPSGVVEAAFRDRGAIAADAALTPAALVGDPQAASSLRSALRNYAEHRRVLLENIANYQTPAYRRRVVIVRDPAAFGGDHTAVPVPPQLSVAPVCTPGAINVTERELDVAIEGDGFFSVVLLDGSTGYTRAGRLFCNADGKLVTADGMTVVPAIVLPNDVLEVSIDPDGCVSGRTAGAPDTTTQFGQLNLHRFVNPAGLLPYDKTVWRATEASGRPVTSNPGMAGLGVLKQGFLEGSNVQLERELLELQLLERRHRALSEVFAELGLITP